MAILFGLCPKFGALVAATPGGVLGGITVVLYGMIGLLGAKIWVENRVDFANPINLVPVGAGIILAIGPVTSPDHRRLQPRAASRSAPIVAARRLPPAARLAPAHMRRTLDAPTLASARAGDGRGTHGDADGRQRHGRDHGGRR